MNKIIGITGIFTAIVFFISSTFIESTKDVIWSNQTAEFMFVLSIHLIAFVFAWGCMELIFGE